MGKSLSTVVCILLVSIVAQSQTAIVANKPFGLLIGSVLDVRTGKAIPFASVSLTNCADTNKRYTEVADKNGSFELDRLSFGLYRLKLSASGFSNMTIDSINIRAERYDFNLGDIKMKPESPKDLNEVVVYAEKPLVENKDGKITYNVGESALSNGSSTSEILKNMPLISNDPTGKILLKGKEPKILIDEKPTDLTADQLKDLLESLPGSSIEKIELMTNPPPQYATEAGGVINIVTRKGKIGMTGKLTLSGGSRGEGSFSGNIAYRDKKLSTNNIFGYSENRFTGNGYNKLQRYYTDSTNYFNSSSNWTSNNKRPSLRSQLDYEFNKLSSLGVTYQGNLNYFNNRSNSQYSNYYNDLSLYKVSTRTNGSSGNGYSHGITLNYTLKGSNPVEVLRLMLNGGIGKNDNGKDYFQQYLDPFYQPTGVDSTQNQHYDSYNSNYSARLSYELPVLPEVILSTGATYQYNTNHNTLNTTFYSKLDSAFEQNSLLSNDFHFNQSISTVRAALIIKLPNNLKIVGGAQTEGTQTDFEFINGNVPNSSRSYWNVLPNMTIRKEFDRSFNTSLSYRASIRRPGLGELNPNIDYSDPNNIRFGNPSLLPSTADNFDFDCSWSLGKLYFSTNLGYNKVKDVFYSIRTITTGNKTQTTYQNIANRKEYESSIWGGYTLSKKVRFNGSAGYSYNQYSQAEKTLFKYQDGGNFYIGLNFTVTPTRLLTIDGNTRYSSYSDPQGHGKSNLGMNFGVQYKMFNKRVIVNFNVFDPFSTQQYITYSYGVNYSQENSSTSNSRNFRLAISYQLNRVSKSRLSDSKKREAIEKIKNGKMG